MDGIEPVVAIDLLDVEVAGVAVAAMYLDREIVGGEAEFRRPAFGDGCEQTEQHLSLTPRGTVCGIRGFVHKPRAVENQRERSFGEDFLRQQHAPDVGMHDDRHLRYLGVSAARGRRPALRAFAGISQRMMIAATGKRGRANADRDARLVHHLET